MIKRLSIYLKEMFPLQVYLPYTLVSFFTLYFLSQIISGNTALIVNINALCGWWTVLGMMFIMRVFDEFKDIDTDRRLFPDRALSRGAVKYSDVKIAGRVVFVLMILANVFFLPYVFGSFLFMMFFAWLTFKWFFAEKLISNNLVLALVTHQPLTLFVNVFIVTTALHPEINSISNPYILYAVLALFFPITAWETSRKIRAKGEETDYVTYSKLFGPVKASLLPFFSMIISLSLLVILAIELNFDTWFYIVVLCFSLVLFFVFIRFMINPVKKNLLLKPVSETIGTLTLLLLLIQLLIDYPISFLF